MRNLSAPIAIGGLLLIVALVLLTLFVGRRMKGTVSVELDRADYLPGETITGTFVIEPKKNLTTQGCTLTLLCFQQERIHDRDETETIRRREIFRKEITITGAVTYPAESTERIPFELSIPAREELPSRILKRSTGGRQYWTIEGRVPLGGLDLKASHKLRIDR